MERNQRNKQRRRILKKLEKVWDTYPDLRLCQLLSNSNQSCGPDMYYTTDIDIEKYLTDYLKKYNKK